MNQKAPKRHLAHQLLMSFGFSLVTVGLTTLGLNYFLIQGKLEQELEQRAQSITQGVGFSTEGLIELGNTSIIKRVVQNYATLPTVVEVAIVSPNGQTLARSGVARQNPPYAAIYPELTPVLEQAAQTGLETSFRTNIAGKSALVEVLPFSSTLFGQVDRRGLVIAILDAKELQQEAWRTFSTSTLTLLIGMAVILVLMTVLIQRTVLHPLQRLNKAVTDRNGIDQFVMPQGLPDNEIRFLAQTMQSAATKVEIYQQELQQQAQELATAVQELSTKNIQLNATLTELHRTQNQIIQAEKMSSLGQMVAGIAHEINNPVSFIHGNLTHINTYTQDLLDLVQSYQQHVPKPPPALQNQIEAIDLDFLSEDITQVLRSMKMGTDRIREIVLSLRNFSRLDESEFKAVDIHEGIDNTLLILQHRIQATANRPAIQLIKAYGDLPQVECYAGQLNQVFMNLLNNAIDALEDSNQHRTFQDIESNPNTIWIYTEVGDSASADLSVRNQIKIIIADNGKGIAEDVRSRLFDPFFTTKPVGKGTGLGLSIGYQIITEKHNGKLYCESTPGADTKFIIEIPVQQQYLA